MKIKFFSAILVLFTALLCSCGTEKTENTPLPKDETAPVFENLTDIEISVGSEISYRSGVVAKDETDGELSFSVDASAVDTAVPGTYTAYYIAKDAAGNESRAERKVIVIGSVEIGNDVEKEDNSIPDNIETSEEEVCSMGEKILSKILTEGMTEEEKAYAIHRYVNRNVKYVGKSDKSDWIKGAYVGFVYGRGDCFTYYACAKVLLNLAGIENIDLARVGGKTQHFWNLVKIDGVWYHFDTCWSPTGYPHPNEGFLITERQAREYTAWVTEAGRPNYYTYDYSVLDALGIVVADTPALEELATATDIADLTDTGESEAGGTAENTENTENTEHTGCPEGAVNTEGAAGAGNTENISGDTVLPEEGEKN